MTQQYPAQGQPHQAPQAPQYGAPQAPQYAAPSQPPAAGSKKPRKWLKWAIPVGTFLLGLTFGAAGSGGDTNNTAGAPVAAEQDSGDTAALQAELDETKAALKESEKAALDAQAAQSEASAALDARKVELDAREAAIQTAEAAFDANNLAPGTYIVGVDIQPGTYKSVGPVSSLCYLGQNNGNDIIWNDIAETGQAVATVENVPNSTFEFQGSCGNLQKVG